MSSGHNWRESARGFLARLAADRAGNAIALIAAAIVPLAAMLGSGIDMGRSYLSESRLQQACDAGVLAARKRLGNEALVDGDVPDEAGDLGQRFFNLNFQDGVYGTEQRHFVMTLEDDFSISGVATVKVPTTIMRAFGFDQVPIRVTCEAQLSMADTDVMMVLDTTGSMRTVNSGDTVSRIEALKTTIVSFHTQLNAAANPATRIRYGFVPYSTNVNVGSVLDDDWVTSEWTYQSRELVVSRGTRVTTTTYQTGETFVSGSKSTTITESYPATFVGSSVIGAVDGYVCNAAPASSVTQSQTLLSTTSSAFAGPPSGTRTTRNYRRTRNGDEYLVVPVGGTCEVRKTTYSNYVDTYNNVTDPAYTMVIRWRYAPITLDVSDWRTTSNGCMEERDSYEIDDYTAVDLTRALDLDIDLVPDASDPSTQWRPMFPNIIFNRAIAWDGSGSFRKAPATTASEYVSPGAANWSACPAEARKLAEMSTDDMAAFAATLTPAGNTYHDIGMIWGGRLLSPSGIFAAENADRSTGARTNRHLIFMTDGETAPRDVSYGTYGVEPLDERRWTQSSALSLTEVIEKRFAVACNEVKKRNITVWVIGFGTTLSSTMTECAGEGHYFNTANAVELDAAFARIAKQMSDLRIVR